MLRKKREKNRLRKGGTRIEERRLTMAAMNQLSREWLIMGKMSAVQRMVGQHGKQMSMSAVQRMLEQHGRQMSMRAVQRMVEQLGYCKRTVKKDEHLDAEKNLRMSSFDAEKYRAMLSRIENDELVRQLSFGGGLLWHDQQPFWTSG